MQEAYKPKAILTFPDLMQGAKDVTPDSYRSAVSSPLKVTNMGVDKVPFMKMIKFSGDCEGYTPVIQFLGWVEKEKPAAPASTISISLGLATATQPEVTEDNLVRVQCNCEEYTAVYQEANAQSGCQYGIGKKKQDHRDLGFEKSPNKLGIPGVCGHLVSLYSLLQTTGKVE